MGLGVVERWLMPPATAGLPAICVVSNMGAPKGSPAYKAYWDDDKAQSRYRDLINARERAGKKAA